MSGKQVHSDDDQFSVDRYSDDFVSEDEMRDQKLRASTPKKSSNHQRRRPSSRASTPRKQPNNPYYQDKFPRRGRSLRESKGRSQGRRTKKGGGSSRASEPADIRKSHDNITSRILSANRNRVNELRNKVEELKIYIRDLQQENRLYKKTQFRQDKAIRVFEDKENDLPSILDKHYNEVRALREQNRRLKEKYEKTDRYLRDAEDELERVRRTLKKYKDICEKKELLERDDLSHRLARAEQNLQEKEARLKELQRHTDLLKKNHMHELGTEVARQKELKKKVEELLERNSQLENELKEKEKALDYHNIYSNPRHGRSSRDSSLDGSLTRKPQKRSSVLPELTPREKAKIFAEKQRAELLKQKELKEEKERKKKQQWEREMRQKASEKKANSEHAPEFVFNSVSRELEERQENERKEREERQRRDRERQEEELQRKQKDLQKRQEQENVERMMEERERKDREERERREQEERRKWEEMKEQEARERREEERKRKEQERREMERLEQERREKEQERREMEKLEQERREKEQERREKEKAEQEKRLQEKKEELDRDPLLQAERKKKDDLLKKLKAIDDVEKGKTDPFTPTLLSKVNKEHSRTGNALRDPQIGRSGPKEYSFSQPINNLHQGKPSHEDITIPYIEHQKQKRLTSAGDDDGYQPSFGVTRGGTNKASSTGDASFFDDNRQAFKMANNTSSNTTKQQDKKSGDQEGFIEKLFGSEANKSKPTSIKKMDNYDPFSANVPSSKSQTRTLAAERTVDLPWNYGPGSGNSRVGSETKSTIFGGGAALIEDDLLGSRSKILPRRQRQQNLNTFAAKPSVMAVDTFEDEIEEFVL